jgi:cell division protease FtsH
MAAASSPHATPPEITKRRRWPLIVFGLLAAVLWFWPARSRDAETPYSTVFGWADAGKIDEVVVEGAVVRGKLREPEKIDDKTVSEFATRVPPEDEELVRVLRERGATIRVESAESPLVLQFLYALAPWLLIIGLWWWVIARRGRKMLEEGPLGGFMRRGKRFEKSKAEPITFANVAGLRNAKRDLEEIVEFLRDPGRVHRLGARVPRGVLLVGPPGTGKTLLARAVAGEANVPFYSISGSEFIELFVGVGAARVRELFAEAKRNAPAIIFVDEIDAVGGMRGIGAIGGGHDEREQTLHQLLSEMDGFDRDTHVVILGATNRPDVLDAALLRPGRFDRRVLVDLPEVRARREILAVHTKDKPLAPGVDLEALAELTVGFSGADLANLANEAALDAARRHADQITKEDFTAAYDKVVLGNPREGILRDIEKRRVAVHESGHALVAWMTPNAEPIRRVSILPRGMSLGATYQVPIEERHLHTRAELVARLLVLLGGYASEVTVLDDVSTGAEHDLREATRIARRMVASYGMSAELGPVSYDADGDTRFLPRRLTDGETSDATRHAIEAETRRLLGEICEQAAALITAHRAELDRLVETLLARETVERADLEAVLGQRPETRDVMPVSAPIPPSTTAPS